MKRVLVAALVVSSLLAGCLSLWSPGEDPRGRQLLRDGDRLLSELERFRAANGVYPPKLEALGSTVDLGRPGGDFYFYYNRDSDSFHIILDYTPSWPQTGRVTCSRRPDARGWGCLGYL